MANKAIFLDRDGTLNYEKNYLYKKEDFEFIPGILDAIRLWNDLQYLVIIVTNQAGVARGYYSENDVRVLHEYVDSLLKDLGLHIDAYYYCPHHPTEGLGKYRIDCDCRKPKPGMIMQAIKDFDIDVKKSFLFGDKESDIAAGLSVGIKSFIVNGRTFDSQLYNFK